MPTFDDSRNSPPAPTAPRPGRPLREVVFPLLPFQDRIVALPCFQNCQTHEIGDPRPQYADRRYPCPDRPRLITQLAEALRGYDEQIGWDRRWLERLRAPSTAALEQLNLKVLLYAEVATRRPSVPLPSRPSDLKRAFRVVKAALARLDSGAYDSAITLVLRDVAHLWARPAKQPLVANLYETLMARALRPEGFPAAAAWHGVALLCQEFGVEDGEARKIADHLRIAYARQHPRP